MRSMNQITKGKKVNLTTTFNKLREADACTSGYKKLAAHLGGIMKYGKDTPINLLTILESNGINDALWCLRATEQNCDRVSRLMAADFAESVLHIFEKKCPNDNRPRLAIKAARDFANGLIDDAALAAAWAAARDAAWAAAWAAVWDAARDAARAAVWDAARDAARAAARDAARD